MLQTLGSDATSCIAAAIAKTMHDLRPVPADPVGRDAWSKAIDLRLIRLAVKVLPTASESQTQLWRDALVEALSDLPAMISLTAAKRAIHRPFRFIGEIETAVREISAEMQAERHQRLTLLRRMQTEVERALRPPPTLPAPAADAPLTGAQIRAMSSDLRRMGLTAGFITQDEIDAALSDDLQQAA
ncbi:hypothetical protein ASE75_06100 [Sphingomonas sp. Leaf17]|nr:hypothetical protein ASE75_06100 [Sphingomonas sp. Leaf17]